MIRNRLLRHISLAIFALTLPPAAFAQALKTMQDVDNELKKRVEEAQKAQKAKK